MTKEKEISNHTVVEAGDADVVEVVTPSCRYIITTAEQKCQITPTQNIKPSDCENCKYGN